MKSTQESVGQQSLMGIATWTFAFDDDDRCFIETDKDRPGAGYHCPCTGQAVHFYQMGSNIYSLEYALDIMFSPGLNLGLSF